MARLSCYALVSILLILMVYCSWTLDKGFDISDESYSLLLAMYPETFKIFVSAAHWITSLLWIITGNLFAFRLLGFVIVILSAAVLGIGVISSAALFNISLLPARSGRIAIIAATEIAALHWCCYGGSVFFTPCYNLIAVSGSYCTIGFILLALSRRNIFSIYLFYLLAGCSIAIVFVCKFPAGISILALSIFITFVFNTNYRINTIGLLAILAAMAISVLILARIQMPLPDVLKQFRSGLHYYQIALPESINSRLLRYMHELWLNFGSSVRGFFIPLCCFLFFACTRRKFFLVAGIVSLGLILVFTGYLSGGFPRLHMQISALVALLMLFMVLTFPLWFNVKRTLFLGILLVLPYCIAFGTNNSLPPQILVSLAPWGTLSILLAFNQKLDTVTQSGALLLSVIFAIVITVPIINSSVHPAYNTQSLTKQNALVELGEIGIIHVDKNMQGLVESLNNAVKKCKIAPGAAFIGLYNMPGVAVIIKAVPVMTPWLITKNQSQSWLVNVPDSITHSAIIGVMLQADGKIPPLPEAISNFPSGYTLCGTASYPFGYPYPKEKLKIQLWAPVSQLKRDNIIPANHI